MLTDIVAQDPDAVVVVVTGHSGVNIAVAAMRAGASDFVMKPWRNDRLAATLQAALELRRRRRESAATRGVSQGAHGTDSGADGGTPILGDSPAIQRARAMIRRVAPTDVSVLILGEAGTGKSLMAQTLHRMSPRAEAPFAGVDFGGLGEDAAGGALFGDGRGPGALGEARGGTLFLDEVGEMSPALQARLLAALDRPGALAGAAVPRLVAASRRRREALRGRGGLREDLLCRLDTVEILAPPLRERGDDVRILAEHFLRLFAQRYGKPTRSLAPEAAEAIAEHPWPGDVRALRQAMERCVIFAEGGRYELADIPMGEVADAGVGSGPGPPRAPLDLARSEKALISQALKRNAFNVSHAARQLGLTRAALYRRMAKHGL